MRTISRTATTRDDPADGRLEVVPAALPNARGARLPRVRIVSSRRPPRPRTAYPLRSGSDRSRCWFGTPTIGSPAIPWPCRSSSPLTRTVSRLAFTYSIRTARWQSSVARAAGCCLNVTAATWPVGPLSYTTDGSVRSLCPLDSNGVSGGVACGAVRSSRASCFWSTLLDLGLNSRSLTVCSRCTSTRFEAPRARWTAWCAECWQ